MRVVVLCVALLAAVGCALESPPAEKGDKGGPPDTNVKLETVTHPQLLERLAGLRGKVVVLDFWGDFCIPCKKEFPHLVELHQKYAKDGLACVSASLDEARDRDQALKFLQKQHAAFANYYLDLGGNWDVVQNHWKFDGPPAVFVFDRAGNKVGEFRNGPDEPPNPYAHVEKLVAKLLKTS